MNRVAFVAASCIAVLAAVSVGQLYMDQPSPIATKTAAPVEPPKIAESRPVTVDEVVSTYLDGFDSATGAARSVALATATWNCRSLGLRVIRSAWL